MPAYRLIILVLVLVTAITTHAQNQDSIQQVIYQTALQKLKDGSYAEAKAQFSQLIATNFSNKEIYVKRGIANYMVKDFGQSKTDFDEAVKARINTEELFEYRGLARYQLDDIAGASGDLDKAVSMGAKSP